ncbi:MAG: hypothetical protein P2A85_23190 [Microcoleus anatoxicus]
MAAGRVLNQLLVSSQQSLVSTDLHSRQQLHNCTGDRIPVGQTGRSLPI